MIPIRPARFADAVALAPALRFEDRLELRSAWSVGPEQGLIYCLLQSDRAFALGTDAAPLALWGVTARSRGGLDLGIPWLLAGASLSHHRRELVARSRRWLERLLLEHDVLTNLTDADNVAHLRWLDWCGFECLREHPRHGRLGRPFREFFRVNGRRHRRADGVRDLLMARPPGAAAGVEPAVAHLVAWSVAVLQGRRREASLADLLHELARVPLPERSRRALLRLLLELAPVLGEDPAGVTRGRSDAARAWIGALRDVAQVVTLAGRGPDADEVLAMLGRPSGWGDRAAPGRSPHPRPPTLDGLAGRYFAALTLDGRVDPVQGYRLWAAAGGEDEAVERPAGLERPALGRAFAERGLLDAASVDAEATDLGRTAAFLRLPAGDGALDRMHAVLTARDVFARALDDATERWATTLRPVGTLAAGCRAAGGLADAVAGALLPTLSYAGVRAGAAERHALYRVLRVRLLLALVADPVATDVAARRRGLCRLLAAEVAGLLAAAAFDDALLGAPSVNGPDTAGALVAALGSVWGARAWRRADPALLVALLMPALAEPAGHACQLPPALLVWHLTETGRVEGLLDDLADLLGDAEREPRAGVRRILRRWARGLDIVDVRCHLDRHDHPGPAQPGRPPPDD